MAGTLLEIYSRARFCLFCFVFFYNNGALIVSIFYLNFWLELYYLSVYVLMMQDPSSAIKSIISFSCCAFLLLLVF